MLITGEGKIIRLPVSEIRVIGRNTQGVRLIGLANDDRLVSVARVMKEESDSTKAAEATAPEAAATEKPTTQPKAEKKKTTKKTRSKKKTGRKKTTRKRAGN